MASGNQNLTSYQANKWTNLRAFTIKDSDSTNAGTSTNVDGTGAITLYLPSTIKGTFTGNASSATKLETAREIYVALGSTRDTNNKVTFNGTADKAIHVSGTLGVARGGTNKSSWTQWGILYASATDTLTNTGAGTAGYLLMSNATSAPTWVDWRKHIFANKNESRTTLTVSDSSWNVTSGTDVFGLSFKDTGLKYTPSGGSATASSDTGDWRAWLTCAADSNTVTLNMRIDGTWQASKFIGPLQGNADTATALTSNAGGTEQPIYFTGGKPSATSYALKATVNNGTAAYLAYYSGARAISSWSYAKFHDGCLSLFPTTSSYREGIRIHSVGSWSDITLCGNDNTGDSGTSANSWFIGNNNGNFYIARNGSPGSTAYLSCVSNVWNFLNQVTFGARVTSTAPSALTNVDRIVITPYYHTGGPWKITSRDDASNAYLSLYYNTTETARMQHNGALLLCNNISFTNSGTAFRGINYGTMGDNDQWRIGGAATAANAGYMELATADDGNEPIYVRQYTGVFTTVKRTLTLLDASGNTTLPGRLFVTVDSDVTTNSGTGSIVIGSTSGLSIGIDANEIMCRSSNAASTLYIQNEGGAVQIGAATSMSSTLSVTGKITGSGGYADRSNGTATFLNYGAAGLANSAITWLACWNGYELRAISKAEVANAVDASHKWARIGGDTMTGVLTTSYKSGTWVNSLTSSAITLTDTASSYGGWICGPTKNGRIAISTYQNSDDLLYIGYGERGRTTNSFTRSMTWNGANGRLTTASVANAIWNDYAEYRIANTIEPGYCVTENYDGCMIKTYERMMPGCRLISDTYGVIMGETAEAQTPIAVAGRVLAYTYQDRNNYPLGAAVCSAPNGTVDIMTREEIINYPERIIGTVSEIPQYENWYAGEKGEKEIPVKGRIWIYVR